MSVRRQDQGARESRWTAWRAYLIGGVVLAAALVAVYFLIAQFVPRWWAQRIAEMSGHGSFAKGIAWGLSLGGLCTAIPLLLLVFMVLVWPRRAGRFFAGASAIIAALAALPNLMTLSIVLGASNAAHAGERILDVEAPGFRGATLVGAIIALVPTAFAVFAAARSWRRRRSGGGRQPAQS